MSRLWDGGFWTTQSLKGLGPQRRLQDCNIEEVAAHFRLGGSSAMRFDGMGTNKGQARALVLDLFGPERYPEPIRVLSMPGSAWVFETSLIRRREGKKDKFHKGRRPDRTELHAVENDRGVFYRALTNVPGMNHPRNVIVDVGRTSYAERVLSYFWINRYVFADVDDLMQSGAQAYDCVWLDYLGPLTLERLAIIKAFFENHVSGTLVITSLKARWTRAVSAALRRFEDYEDWLREEFGGYTVDHYVEYFDTSPMVQIAVSKTRVATH